MTATDNPPSEAPQTGAALIAEKVRSLPNAPGVYRMIDRDGEVIYVGKARDLKKRVSAYAKGQGHTARIARMIMATADMAFVQTASETEAPDVPPAEPAAWLCGSPVASDAAVWPGADASLLWAANAGAAPLCD